jgi:hypothetical protein
LDTISDLTGIRDLLFLLIGALIVMVGVVAAIGATLPREHTASRTAQFSRPPQDVWACLTEATSKSRVPVDVLESRPPHLLVTRVKESEKMFGGTWTIAIAPSANGSTVTITEEGWVANPIFRFVSRFVIGHHATMDSILKAVSAAL